MTNEIKEILDILTFNKEDILNKICSVEDFVSREQIIKLLDYVTNLQEENEQLKELTKDKSYCENCEFKKDNEKIKLENRVLKEQMVAMVQPNYTYGITLQGEDNEGL